MINNFPTFLNFNQLFLKLKQLICNWPPVLPDHSSKSPGSCDVEKSSWYRKYGAKIFDFEPQISNRTNKSEKYFGTEKKIWKLGQHYETEGVLFILVWKTS